MASSLFQTSFAAGELSPSMYARVDLAKYKVGAATLRNFYVDYRGGASSRAGTRYIATSATPGSGLPPRLIGFQFSTLQTYVLEFGAGYIGFIKNGAPIISGGAAYTIASPYALADLPLLKFTQSADVMTLVHPSYAPRQLNRYSDVNWTLTTITFVPIQQPPTGGTAAPTHGSEAAATGDATTTTYTYCVTAVAATGEESEAGPSFSTPADSRVMSQDGNAFVTCTWTAPSGAAPAYYQIYRMQEVPNGAPPAGTVFGLIGSATSTSYVDRDGAPDFTTSPPQGDNPFASGNNPGVTTYFAQRQWFAASTSMPETFWASKIGAFQNMDVSQPVQASDAITATIASTQVNAIKHMVPMSSGIVTLSSGGAWLISGGSVGQGGVPGAITPMSLVAQPQAYNGCSDLPPIVVNYDVLFVQEKGSIVRDLSYNFYVNIYTGTDMTALSNHLFAGRTLREWAFAEEPYKLIWTVRDDGILLCFSYMKEQDVYAWTRHDTAGLFQSVCAVSENTVDATYFVVKRYLAAGWVYCIERMADRSLIDGNPALGIAANIENAWCVDCGLSLPQPAPAANLTIAAGANAVGASLAFSTDAAVFSSGSTGSVIRANGGHATITGYVSPTVVFATVTVPFAVLPNDPALTALSAAAGAWTMTAPATVVTGLDHLDGKTVSILADGNVVAPQVVEGGTVILQQAASSVVVGLPFQCQLQTLNIDIGEGSPGGSIQGKQKKVGAVTVRVKDTRGLKAGRTPATVVPVKEWSAATYLGGPLPLVTGDQRVIMDPLYEQSGRFWLQLDEPTPATVLGVVPELTLGG
jgi:hypothetical protein